MKKMFLIMNKLLKVTILEQIYLLWTAPIDGETRKFIKGHPISEGSNKNFTNYDK